MTDASSPGDTRTRWARIATLVTLGLVLATSVMMPGVAVSTEPRGWWQLSGAVGTAVFAAALGAVLYAAMTPWLSAAARRWAVVAFLAAAVLTVPLAAPVGAREWATWAWIGGTVVGIVPVIASRPVVAWCGGTLLTGAVAAGVAVAAGASPLAYLGTLLGVAVTVAMMSTLPIWLWDLLVDAQAGRAAQARLAAAEERLRFARDVHDLLGHNLSVIALKAELAARLARTDPERAAAEAEQVQRLAGSALTDVRAAVHGYRQVDVGEQLAAVAEILRSSGVRCTVTQPAEPVPPVLAGALVMVVKEATTNVLRHSQAAWCTIDITRAGGEWRLTVANDGVTGRLPDAHSHGLRGMADRLADLGGTLRTDASEGVFTLDVTVRDERDQGSAG